jgi:predicted GH43/DUF377 family glycosyl hydrolase
MNWEKKGLIYCPGPMDGWRSSYASIPTPYQPNDEIIRIYCAFRAGDNVSRIGYVDVCAQNPSQVLSVSPQPVLDIGAPGMFDDNGVLPSSIVDCKGRLYLYYSGFQLGTDVPYTIFSGLAVSDDNGDSFQRIQQTPVVGRNEEDIFFRAAPHVMYEDGIWKMWYIGGNSWTLHKGKPLPVYSIKYMESPDGICWDANGHICMSPQGDDEHGFGRPFVIREENRYGMYYSIRTFSKGYRLGYAQSPNGISWVRDDAQINLDISPGQWDSETLCYSALMRREDKYYLFYNGNHYGQTGFGYAEAVA